MRAGLFLAAMLLAGCHAQPVANQSVAATPSPAPVENDPQALAFAAVFGTAPPFVRQIDKNNKEKTSPVQLIRQGDRAVLITKTEEDPGCHYCEGSLGIYYLKPACGGFEVTGKFPRAIRASGLAPNASVSDKFGPVLTLVSDSSSGGQGYSCGWIELTELAADRPRKLVRVTAGTDGTGDGPRPHPGSYQLKGEMGDIVPGKSFTITYSGIRIGTEGKQNFSETYVRTANGYAPTGKSKLQACPVEIF